VARAHLKKAVALAPDDSSVVTRSVRVNLAAGDPEAATDVAGTFFRKHPEMLAAYQIQAALQEVVGRPADARRTLALGAERLDGNVGIVLLQAEFERRQGELETATELYKRVIELEPKAVAAMVRKAETEMASGHFEEAADSYQSALGMAPGQPVALNNLAYLYTDVLDRPADALALLKQVDPKVLASSPAIRDTLGWTQLKAGKTASAVDTLKKAAADLPGSGTVRYHLGAALIAHGKTDDGRREIKAAIDLGLSPSEAEAARALLTEHTEDQRK
jgi:Flp pilus assembly protein TadD